MATDQLYDYLIPNKYKEIIAPGMRVIIPFGPRKITGFVIEMTADTDVKQLREIIEVIDLTPVLTDELIQLGRWLVSETLCFHISAYQAMLPQLLRMTYDKELVRIDEHKPLPPALAELFNDRTSLNFSEIDEKNISYHYIKQAVESNALAIKYLVQSRETKKYITYIKPTYPVEKTLKIIEQISKQAKRQRDIINYLKNYPKGIRQGKLIEDLKVSRSSIQALEDKQLIKVFEEEVYRSPYDIKDFQRTEPLPLTVEQQAALMPIHQTTKAKEHKVFLLHGVTGSGKTEIYLQAIAKVIAKGQEAIMLVPEIALTPQMVKVFK